MAMLHTPPQTLAASGAATAGGRRPTIVAAPDAASPELSERPRRRTFTAKEKLRILEEADRAPRGGLGALLRREGLYSSALTEWRRQRDAGALSALTPLPRGPKRAVENRLATDLTASRQDNILLRQRLERAEAIIDLQKKLAELLGMPILPPIGEPK